MNLGNYEDIYLGKWRKGVYPLDPQCWLDLDQRLETTLSKKKRFGDFQRSRVQVKTREVPRWWSNRNCGHWPPSPCVFRVFSSKTERWEERSFVREGKAASTIADMRLVVPTARLRNAVYW